MIVAVIAAVAALMFIGMLGLTLFDAAFRPSFRRLALRNIARRPGEAVLIIVGSMLGTAIITAAFIVGDTFEQSVLDIARTQLGPIDVEVSKNGLDGEDALLAAVADLDAERIDGTLTARTSGVTVATVGDDPRAEPSATMTEVDFDDARAFGPDPSITGFADAGATPTGDQIVLSDDLADKLSVTVGDAVDVFSYGQERRFIVAGRLAEAGVAGFGGAFVPPGTIESLATASTLDGAAPPRSHVLLSLRGGVFDIAEADSVFIREIAESRVTGIAAVEVNESKYDLLEEARAEGDNIGQLFITIGSFSVLVGVLLLVNLFVMLAEERKSELGMLRAIGLKRNHLLRTFSLEGAMYSLVAAVSGGFVGIGVGWAITQVVDRILSSGDDALPIVFDVEPASIVTGVLLGLSIALVTVWATSIRIARLNVIRAIRDLPEPNTGRPKLRTMLISGLGAGIGVVLLQVGVSGESEVLTLAGPAIALLSAIPLARGVLPQRTAVVGLAGASLLWGIFAFSVFPSVFTSSGIEVFVVQGVVLVSSSVLVVTALDHLWVRISDVLVRRGRGLATRLALAYPIARKVRTGILLAMFSLIIFTMTFMSVFTEIFGKQAQTFADSSRGGFDLYIDSNFSNPVTAAELAAVDGVEAVAPFVRSFPDFTAPFEPEPTFWSTAGFDQTLIATGGPELSKRAAGFASDKAVFEAVLTDPTKAIVPDYFLNDGPGPAGFAIELGDTITMYSRTTDETLDLEVVGINDSDFIFNGVLVGADTLRDFLGSNAFTGRYYVSATTGTDLTDLALRLNGQLIEHGVEAESFLDAVEQELAEQQGFFRLMQGYLGLGLLIGIAGLGVVMTRAVRERRRQIGMLRAMGFPASMVRRAFLLEATLVAVQGIALGIGLGLLTAYQLLSNSDAFGDQSLPFAVPWSALVVVFVVPLGASLLATFAPAAQASRISPAAALRIAD